MIRKIAIAIVCVLLLTSCQAGPEEKEKENEAALGRYLEESMPFPDLLSIQAFDEVNPDEFYLAGYDSDWALQIWRSTDGCQSWEELQPPWLEAARQINIDNAAFTGGNSCYLAEWNRNDGEEETQIYLADEFGLHPIEANQTGAVRSLSATSSGQLISANGEHLVSIDPAAGTATHYPVGEGIGYYRSASNYAVFEHTLVVLENDGQFVLIDLDTGAETIRFSCQSAAPGIRAISVAADHSAVVYCDASGVYRQTLDGILTEKIIDGRMASFSMPNLRIESIHMRQDGAFLILCEKDDGGFELHKYQFDPTAPTVPSKQLTVYTMWDNVNVRLAAAVFMRKHPDVLVDLQIGKGEDDAIALDDAVRALNTQLLAGAGPDILILDDLPMKSYLKKNVLADLNAELAPRLSSGDLYEEVAGAYRDKGSICAVPASFSVPILAGNDVAGIQGMKDLTSYLDRVGEPLVYIPEDSMDWFYEKLAHRWFDSDGAFLLQAFQEDLPAINSYAEYPSERTIHAPKDLFNQTVWYSGGGLTILLGNISSVDDASVVLTAAGKRGEEVVSFGGAFLPASIYGVNAAGPQVELATEYVLEALGEEAQGMSIYNGIPVNRRAVQALVERKDAGKGTYLLVQQNEVTQEEYRFEVAWFQEEDAAYFLDLLDTVNNPAPNNAIIRQIVLDETKGYFLGTDPLEDVVSGLDGKLKQYEIEQ